MTAAGPHLRRHLDLLNTFLALRFGQPDYPRCLEEVGYLLRSIGVTMLLADGTRIAPDVVATREDPDLTLLVEVKGGRDLDMDQLARMLRATPEDLRDIAHLPVRDVSSHRVHVVYFCNEECRQGFADAVATRSASVIGFDGCRFRIAGAALPDADLEACLVGAKVNTSAVPLAIVPFDADSPREEVVRSVLPQVIDALVRGVGTISLDDVVAKTHDLVRPLMQATGSGSELPRIHDNAARVMRDLASAELSEWLEPIPKQRAWRLRKSLPTDSTRTRELQKLRRVGEKYLEQLGSRTGVQLDLPYNATPPGEPAEEPGDQ